MKRAARAAVLAGILLACAPDASAQVSRPVTPAEQRGRVVIVTGGIVVSVGIALSWTGITGLVYQLTQHRSVPWAAPVSIASIPVEVVGSGLVVAGALDLLGQRRADVAQEASPAAVVAPSRSVLSLPIVQATF
jgi:hypothetical protein